MDKQTQLLIAFVLLTLVLFLILVVQAAEYHYKKRKYIDDITDLLGKNEELNRQHEADVQRLDVKDIKIRSQKRVLDSYKAKLDTADKDNKLLQKSVESLTGERNALKDDNMELHHKMELLTKNIKDTTENEFEIKKLSAVRLETEEDQQFDLEFRKNMVTNKLMLEARKYVTFETLNEGDSIMRRASIYIGIKRS